MMLLENLHCKEAVMFYGLYEFLCGHRFPHGAQWKSGCLSQIGVSEVLLWSLSTAAVNSLQNSPACLPSVLRSALRLTVQRHFSALLMQLHNADKGEDCFSWQWGHARAPDLNLHRHRDALSHVKKPEMIICTAAILDIIIRVG